MNRLLKAGDVFRSRAFSRLAGKVVFHGDEEPFVDLKTLSVCRAGTDSSVETHWTEKNSDGFTRKRQSSLDLRARDYSGDAFVVVHTKMTGGGSGHGPHDVYPDGHQVFARPQADPSICVLFFQSGSFIGVVAPSEVELVGGETDMNPPVKAFAGAPPAIPPPQPPRSRSWPTTWYRGDDLCCWVCGAHAENAGQLDRCPSCGLSAKSAGEETSIRSLFKVLRRYVPGIDKTARPFETRARVTVDGGLQIWCVYTDEGGGTLSNVVLDREAYRALFSYLVVHPSENEPRGEESS